MIQGTLLPFIDMNSTYVKYFILRVRGMKGGVLRDGLVVVKEE